MPQESEMIQNGYKKTDIGIIPDDWGVTQLEDIAIVKTGPFGAQLHQEDYVSNGTPIITVEHLSEFGIVIDEYVPMVSNEDKERLKQYILQKDDIVFSRVGSIDRSSIVTEKEDGWLFSGRLLRVRFKKIVYAQYFNYTFQTEPFKQRVKTVAVGQTMPSLNTKILNSIFIPLPPTLEEQRAIADALSAVDAQITALDDAVAKKRDIKQGAMQRLLTGEGRLPGFSGEWDVKRLGEIAEKIIGGGTPSRSIPEYWNGSIPWMTVKDFSSFDVNTTEEYITELGLAQSSANLIPAGTVITSTRMGLGKAVIFNVDVSINQDLKAVFTNNFVISDYLFYWFEMNASKIERIGSGSTVKGIALSDLKAMIFLTPPIEEQRAIATVLSDMQAEITALEVERDKTISLKQGMMQDLLTGKVRLV